MSTTSTEDMLACSTIVPVVSIVVVSWRLHTRLGQKVQLGFDDWAQIPALLLFIGMAVSTIIGVHGRAFGYSTPEGPPTVTAPSTVLSSKLLFAIQLLQIPALALIKSAAFWFYRRIFCPHAQGTLNMLLWSLIALTASWAGVLFITYLAACRSHPAAAWQSQISYVRYCKDSLRWEEAFAISDFILDVAVLLLPLPMACLSFRGYRGRQLIRFQDMDAADEYEPQARSQRRIYAGVVDPWTRRVDVKRQDTQAVWFSMLETGFSPIAVNLPTFWGTVSRRPLDAILHSVRSLSSLNSLSSRGTRTSHRDTERGDKFAILKTQDVALEFDDNVACKVDSSEGRDVRVGRQDVENGLRV